MRIAVVGAGLSGLVAANRLSEAGHDVVVMDKARAVGGRMASKRAMGSRFDIGAQHFSVRSDAFADEVASWRETGVVATWFRGRSITEPDRGTEDRHVGVPAMRSIPEHLADGLEVRLASRVGSVGVDGDDVVVDGERFEGAIVTAPLPQSIAMLAPLPVPAEAQAIRYEPCLVVMAVLDRPLGSTHLVPDHADVAWVAENSTKGLTSTPSVTVHASDRFSNDHLDEAPEEWLRGMVDEVERITGRTVRGATTHRWRYSRPTNPLDVGSVVISGTPPIVLAGEAFAGAKVEGAFLSGVHAAGRF